MLLAEPPPMNGEVHFRLLDTPVRIHPYFWITALLLGMGGFRPTPPADVIVWVVAMLVSILLHEFGHALLQRRYGGHPRITLYGLGGLAACDDCDRSSKAQIQISLAGPFAGFLLAFAIIILLKVSGRMPGLVWGSETPKEIPGLDIAMIQPLMIGSFYWKPLGSGIANQVIGSFIQINILWGLINLLPIYPLDGGRVSREVCMMKDARQGIILSWQISMICAGALALLSLVSGRIFGTVLFGYLAYSSYRSLEAYKNSLW